ncbi:hypothetical protein NL676_029208 [Syzygium grande]|nr:hypothetical protein NL676_029208 [Syzygium grande]
MSFLAHPDYPQEPPEGECAPVQEMIRRRRRRMQQGVLRAPVAPTLRSLLRRRRLTPDGNSPSLLIG